MRKNKFFLILPIIMIVLIICLSVHTAIMISKKIIDECNKEIIEIQQEIEDMQQRLYELEKGEAVETYYEPPNFKYDEESGLPYMYLFSDEEIYMLAQLLCGQKGVDGDGEYDFEYQLYIDEEYPCLQAVNETEVTKVLGVVMNRVLAKDVYADNVKDVLLQPGAFTVFPKNLKTEPSESVIKVVREWCQLYNVGITTNIPPDHYWFKSAGNGTNVTRNVF